MNLQKQAQKIEKKQKLKAKQREKAVKEKKVSTAPAGLAKNERKQTLDNTR